MIWLNSGKLNERGRASKNGGHGLSMIDPMLGYVFGNVRIARITTVVREGIRRGKARRNLLRQKISGFRLLLHDHA